MATMLCEIRYSDTTGYHSSNTLFHMCLQPQHLNLNVAQFLNISFCWELRILFIDVFIFLFLPFEIKVYSFEVSIDNSIFVYIILQWNYSYTMSRENKRIIRFPKNSTFDRKKWFAKSCLSKNYCSNKTAITIKFIVWGVIIQTCDYNT